MNGPGFVVRCDYWYSKESQEADTLSEAPEGSLVGGRGQMAEKAARDADDER